MTPIPERVAEATPGAFDTLLPRLSERDFALFRDLVQARIGIAMPPHKRVGLETRLGRRIRALGLPSFRTYYDLLVSADGAASELTHFIHAVTTRKTDFFREAHHFSYLRGPWAATQRAKAARDSGRRLRLWSAGCASGEEPYTLAMVLTETGLVPPAWDVRILASDVDDAVLDEALAARYPVHRLHGVSPEMARLGFVRSATESAVEVRPEIRDLVTFRHINLAAPDWPIRTRFDMIFCRNVLIYFGRDTQRRIVERLVALLTPDGILALGHAESVVGLVDGLTSPAPTMYTRARVHAVAGAAGVHA